MLTSTNTRVSTETTPSTSLTGQELRVQALENMVRARTSTILADALGFDPESGFDLEIESVTVNAEYDPGHHGADWGYAVVRKVGGRKTAQVVVHHPWMSDHDFVAKPSWATLLGLTGRPIGKLRGRRLARRLGIK